MKPTTVKLENNRELEIRKLPLGKYAELIKSLKGLLKQVGGLDKLSTEQLFEVLPELIANNLPEFIKLFTIATDLTYEEAEQLGLDEAVKIVVAIVEVNNYRAVYENLKKVFAHPPVPTQNQIASKTTTG